MKSLKDRRLKTIFLGRYRTGREKWRAATALIVAGLTLFGLGQGIVALYEGATTSDQVNRLAALSGPPDGVMPVTLIDIDDRTHAAWGMDGVTPHGALAELIAIARERQPLAIVVDIGLAFDDPGRKANPALEATLAGYQGDWPPLLLVRQVSFKRSDDGRSVASAYRATAYDSATANKAKIIWVSALPQLGSDRVVRQMRLWQPHCEGQGEAAAVKEVRPAPPLALLAALDGCARCAEMKDYLDARALGECRGDDSEPATDWPPFRERIAAIPYAINGDGEAIGSATIAFDGNSTDLIRRVSAGILVSHAAATNQTARAGEIDAEPFKRRIVLIGGTHGGTGDIHMTPFGSMQGAIVIANALAAAKAMIEAPDPGPFKRHALAFVLFVAFVFIAARFEAAPAALVIGLIGIAALALFSRAVGFSGALEAVATGLAAFGLFKLLDSIVGIAHQWRRGRGWRAIFKPPQTPAR
jgi:CHASE2 domain-containing sensor protein